MSTLWTADEARQATGGTGAATWAARGVGIDSRTVRAGDLFVALKGPTHDGHDHVAAALAAGAAAALVDHAPAGIAGDAPLLRVGDTQQGLEALARAARARFAGQVVALTGSVGKTGTKEMLARLLASVGPTAATEGNLNNHIGAPLTLARLPRDAAFAVLELGMNHAGEISPLSRMARPDCALVTRIAPAHSAFFASVEAIAEAKAEIFEGLAPGGTAIVNADDGHAERLAAAARRHGAARVLRFGEARDADARLLACDLAANGSTVEADILGQRLRYRLGAPGRHWVLNSLGALAAVAALGVEPDRAAALLADQRPPAGRGATERLVLPQGPVTLIDESYNASPAAMRAAFAVLAHHAPPAPGRRVAVLGDMLELGATAAREHAALGAALAALPVDAVFAAGPEMATLVAQLRADQRTGHAPDTAALAKTIVPALRAGDVILVKGSLGIGMARIVRALREAAAPEGLADAL
ncbi:MAG: UDP-N-acetylmuramoyl-tripeptide--D-alanyl-D-alanine ligase [Alphaproteobacteria bacterium]|nr:UDP-N-acetylmuramoyl-tripeptide--D-alanyl-D-alanine ligase [Alphaproteobacteria bacterium]